MKRMAGTLTTFVALSLAASCGREVEFTDQPPVASEDAGATVAEAGREAQEDSDIDVMAGDAASGMNDSAQDGATAVDGNPDASTVGVDDGGSEGGNGGTVDAGDVYDAIALCEGGATQCSGSTPLTCVNGQWQSGTACSAFCDRGSCASAPPSCLPGGPGLTDCGASRESCCTSLEVPGGTFDRTYNYDGGPPTVENADPATVSSFRLDKYLVTVGRFRQFVAAWNGGAGWLPPLGSGKHTHLNAGSGLNATAGGYELGWVATDDSHIEPPDANSCIAGVSSTWTSAPATQETLPINCVNWCTSYAFCIWDGGFLPSEAEWEYAAAGGSEQREYPWGTADPGTANQYAIYGDGEGNCFWPTGTLAPCPGGSSFAPVGTATLGAALWGQLDMAGELWEWNLDWYGAYADPCADCADVTAASGRLPTQNQRVFRGGGSSDVLSYPTYLPNPTPTSRGNAPALYSQSYVGFRCARTP